MARQRKQDQRVEKRKRQADPKKPRAKAARRGLQGTQGEVPEGTEEDEVTLVQTGLWLETLQEDLDFRKSGGEKVGAHVQQLMAMMEQMQARSNAETWEAVQALLAAYGDEEADESRSDRADEFFVTWSSRLQVLLLRDAGILEDTPTEEDDGVVKQVEQTLLQERKRRKDLREAKAARREDDRALREAMADNKASSSTDTEKGDRMVAAGNQYKAVQLKRVLLHGVALQGGRDVMVCGSQRAEGSCETTRTSKKRVEQAVGDQKGLWKLKSNSQGLRRVELTERTREARARPAAPTRSLIAVRHC